MSIAILLATVLPLAALSILIFLGRGARRLWPLALAALAWGFVAPSLIIGVNDSWAANYGLVSLIVVGAPISEEIAKAAILPFLSVSRRVTWFVDGAVLGAAAGTGFAIRENWFYLERVGGSDSISLVIARATSTNLMHAGCTAIVGAAVVLSYRRGWVARITLPLAGLLVAMTLHSVFNRLTVEDNASAAVITVTGVLTFCIAVGIILLGFPITSRWVRRDLASNGASASEQAALGGRSVAQILDAFEARYGARAAEKAEQLVKGQRQLAIARNSGRSTSSEIDRLESDTDVLRREIGLFEMMWLRSHLPIGTDNMGMWSALDKDTLQSTDGEMSAPAAPAGVWARLDSQLPDSDSLSAPIPFPSDQFSTDQFPTDQSQES